MTAQQNPFEPTPSVIVFRPFRRARVYRFHAAYELFQQGNSSPMQALEAELVESIPKT